MLNEKKLIELIAALNDCVDTDRVEQAAHQDAHESACGLTFNSAQTAALAYNDAYIDTVMHYINGEYVDNNELLDATDRYVGTVKGRAMCDALGSMMETLGEYAAASSHNAANSLSLLTYCPYGSITPTFKNEFLKSSYIRALVHMVMAIKYLDDSDKIMTANIKMLGE